MMAVQRYIKSYIPFALNEIKAGMQYRLSFFIRILSSGFTVLITYYLWKAIYSSSSHTVLEGFNFSEMTSYLIVSFFTATMISSVGTMGIAYEIANGQIAMNLIKPISYKAYVYSSSLGSLAINSLITGFPFMIILAVLGWINTPSIGNLVLYLLSIICSFTVLFLFGFCFAMLAFYTTYFFGLNMAKEVIIKFLSGSMIPLAFFPQTVEKVLSYLPFASMNYTPVMIYLGKLSGKEAYFAVGLQLFWILTFYLLSNILWENAVKRLTILGG